MSTALRTITGIGRARAAALRAAAVALIIAGVTASITACERGNAAERDQMASSPAAQRLVGAWDVTFFYDRRASIGIASSADSVVGMMAFTTDLHGRVSTEELEEVTHDGTYDLDFRPFGWTTRDGNAPTVAVARVVDRSPAAPDSLYVVLSPGTERFAVRLAGTFAADSASGVWSARAYSAGGGLGHFVMRRHSAPR